MNRILFNKPSQEKWMRKVREKLNITDEKLSIYCGVKRRTFSDWKSGKYTIPEDVALKLSAYSGVTLPMGVQVVDEFWYVLKGASMGGKKRYEKYGLVGNIESRRKGGRLSQFLRKQNPEKYRRLGCNTRKKFKKIILNEEMAEMAGIILGDGGITKYQLKITLNRIADIKYIPIVVNLSKKIFGETFKINNRRGDGAVDLSISGINLIEALENIGICSGNKITRQVNFPDWIINNKIFCIACVRGLVDTDGCVFMHNHIVNGVKYNNIGINFVSRSIPLLFSVSKTLNELKIKHYINIDRGAINIYALQEIIKYNQTIGFSNPKHSKKINAYLMYNSSQR